MSTSPATPPVQSSDHVNDLDDSANQPSAGPKAVLLGLVAVLVIGCAALFLGGGSGDDYSLDLSVVEPNVADLVTLDQVRCPTSPAASSPIPSSNAVLNQGRIDGSRFASGAIVAWNLVITSTAAEDAPDPEFLIDFNDAIDETQGVVCSFVVTDDPANVSVDEVAPTAAWVGEADEEKYAGTLSLTGTAPGETTVVQFWTLIDPEGGTQPSLRARVNPQIGIPAAPSSRNVRTSFKQPVEPTDGTLELKIVDGDAELSGGGTITATWTVANTTSDRVFDFIDVSGGFEGDVTLEDLNVVSDTDGSLTTCAEADSGFVCSLGFMKPGETVVINATGSVDSNPESFYTGVSGECVTNGQDICSVGTLGYLGQFDRNEIPVSEAADVGQDGDISVAVYSDPEIGYLNRPLTLQVVIASSSDEVTIDAIELTGCPDDELDLTSGDLDGDARLDRSEVWQFTCLARLGAPDGEVIVRGTTTEGGPAQVKAPFEIELISPGIRLIRTNEETATKFSVQNLGDVELSELAVTSAGCDPVFTEGDTDADGAVDPDEVWEFFCQVNTAPGRVFAVDELGGVVTSTEILAEDL